MILVTWWKCRSWQVPHVSGSRSRAEDITGEARVCDNKEARIAVGSDGEFLKEEAAALLDCFFPYQGGGYTMLYRTTFLSGACLLHVHG